MSEQDSFIREVTEEVERDRLFGLFRRYGWIAVVAILVVVGGAGWNEIRKARFNAAAEMQGDAILAALNEENAEARTAALAQLLEEAPERSEAITALIVAGASDPIDEADKGVALAGLQSIIDDPGAPRHYKELAALKSVLLQGDDLSPEEKIQQLQPLSVPGAPFRLLALEQIALAQAGRGDNAEAIETLREVLFDANVSQGLRQRASQLIVALGGTLDAA